MVKITVKEDRDFLDEYPVVWEMVKHHFMDVENFLEYEGFNVNGRLIPGSRYIYMMEVAGLDRTGEMFKTVMNDLNEHFPELIFQVI